MTRQKHGNIGMNPIARAVRLVVVGGPLLEQTIHSLLPEGLDAQGAMRLEAARSRTPWGRSSRRRLALLDGTRLVASAIQADLSAIYEGETIPVCSINGMSAVQRIPAADRERLLIDLIELSVERARAAGAALVILARPAGAAVPPGFTACAVPDLQLTVARPKRYGAPMTMVRGGDERDLPAIVAMGRTRAARFRLHLDRNRDLIQYAIITKRLFCGVAAPNARQFDFVIAEEGTTAAAYVVISRVGRSWTIEECGDRDPDGARVGALLQALIAREPSEEPPMITAWLPPGFRPPQVTLNAATGDPSQVLMINDLRSAEPLPLGADDLLFWRSDLLT